MEYILLLIRPVPRLLRARERESVNAIQLKWIRAIRRSFFFKDIVEKTMVETIHRIVFILFFPLRARSFESRVDQKPRAFLRPRTDCRCLAFATGVARKGISLSLSFSLLSLLHSCVTRAELHIALYKEATVASDVLSGEFQAEAIHSSPLCCFTAIIARTLLDAASGLTILALSNAFPLGAAGKRQQCRLSTCPRRVFAK